MLQGDRESWDGVDKIQARIEAYRPDGGKNPHTESMLARGQVKRQQPLAHHPQERSLYE